MNMDFLVGPIVVGTICYFLYKILQLYACRRERIILAEKLGYLPDTNVDTPDCTKAGSRFVALRFGAVLSGLGLGLLIAYLINIGNVSAMYADGYNRILDESSNAIYGACTLLGGGIGLLISFFVEIRLRK